MNRRAKLMRKDRTQRHMAHQRAQKQAALIESEAEAKRQKKGAKGIDAQMHQRGYEPFTRSFRVKVTGQNRSEPRAVRVWRRINTAEETTK